MNGRDWCNRRIVVGVDVSPSVSQHCVHHAPCSVLVIHGTGS
jgi:hypothetical protein